MKERLRSLQKYIEVYRCVGIDKVLKTIPCRFAYSVANEHVDEKKFHEKVLYRMRHNKYDSLRKSYNKVIKNKVNDVKQGLYQTIYLTLTALAVGWGFIPGPQPVSRNEVPYAVAKKEKNMMTKHSLYVFIILLSIYFVTLHIML